MKLAPFDERQREFVTAAGMGVAEARFYRDLAQEVPVRVPRPYLAQTDGDRYVMVLEDLEAVGCRFPVRRILTSSGVGATSSSTSRRCTLSTGSLPGWMTPAISAG